MSEPIVIVDCSEVREGRLEDLRAVMDELVAFANANEPRMIFYGMYLSEDGTVMTVVQAHPESASAEYHMEAAAHIFPKFRDLIVLSTLDVYGAPSADLLARLQRKAHALGTATVKVHPLHAGFARPAV